MAEEILVPETEPEKSIVSDVILDPATDSVIRTVIGSYINNNPPDDLDITSQAQGDIIYFNGTNWVRLAAGTTGQLLQTKGSSANPAWSAGTPAAGSILYYNGTNWDILAPGTANQFLKTPGGSGNPAWANVESVRVTRSSTQNFGSTGAETAIAFAAESFDTNGFWNGGATTRITFVTAGKYCYGLSTETSSAYVKVRIRVRLNGTTILDGHGHSNVSDGYISLSGIYNFAANDYIEFMVTPADGSGDYQSCAEAIGWAYGIV